LLTMPATLLQSVLWSWEDIFATSLSKMLMKVLLKGTFQLFIQAGHVFRCDKPKKEQS